MNTLNKPSPWKTVFSRSGLPGGVIGLMLALICTHAVFLLLAQPRAYWLDPRAIALDPRMFYISGSSPGGLAARPLPFAFLGLAYLTGAGLLLAVLPPTAARLLAGGLFAFHLIWTMSILNYGVPPLFIPQGSGPAELVLTVFTGACGGLLVFFAWDLFSPPGRLRRWSARAGGLLLAAWVVLLAYNLGLTIHQVRQPAADAWRPLVSAHMPSGRFSAGLAYDTQRQRAVLFGGQVKNEEGRIYNSAETWEWDGQDWALMATGGPSGRAFAAMGYDPQRKVVVLYGGQNDSGLLSDVWEWDGHTWRRMCPNCNPAARWGARFVYDEQAKQLVLYGGLGEKGAWYAESWSWNGSSWGYNEITSSAPATINPAIAYETGQQRALVYVDDPLGGTWTWQNRAFSHQRLAIHPPTLVSAALVYDPLNQRSILYGGLDARKDLYSGQTWVYANNAWTRLDPALAPTPREGMVAFYDPTRQSLIVFGGRYISYFYGDQWELPLAP